MSASKEEIFKVIEKILTEKDLLKEDLTWKTKLVNGGISLSSIDTIEMIINIEERFNIEFPDEYLNLALLGDMTSLVDLVYQLIN